MRKGAREYRLPLISYSCGVLLGFLSVGIYFLSHGALDDVIWNSYIQCRYQLATWGLAFPSLSETLALLSTGGWHAFVFSEGFRWYLPICVFLIVAAYLTYRSLCGTASKPNAMKLLLLLLGGIAFFRTALGRSDGGHLIYGATFLWLLCLLPLESGIFRIISCYTRRETLATRIESSVGTDSDSNILLVCWGGTSSVDRFS